LKRARKLLKETSDEVLRGYAQQYATFLKAHVGGQEIEDPAAPSFAVELMWQTHLLHPMAYIAACESLSQPGCSSTVVAHSLRAEYQYAQEDTPGLSAHPDTIDEQWLGCDLVAALRKQEGFMQSVTQKEPAEDDVVAAIQQYEEYLATVRHSKNPAPPSSMVDLVWHTHLQMPHRYASDCHRVAGTFVDHDTSDAPSHLSDLSGTCGSQWLQKLADRLDGETLADSHESIANAT